MKKLLIPAAAIVLMAACTGKTAPAAETEAAETPAAQSLAGEWLLESIVVGDSTHVAPQTDLTVSFNDDSTFCFSTGCNTICGTFGQQGDSLSLTNMLTTEMACDDMTTEDVLKTILLDVSTLESVNDTTVRLNTTPPQTYITLRREAAR